MTGPTQQCDVFIAGAGPAGSTTAYLLARQGWDVLLCDRRTFPRPKLCAGLLTWKTMDLLQTLFHTTVDDLLAQGIICHISRNYRIYRNSAELARGELVYPFHFVDRRAYDHYWLEFARKAGARVLLANGVVAVEPAAGRVTLRDGRHIRAKVIIGADGVWSIIRRSLFSRSWEHRRWRPQLAMTIETRREFEAHTSAPPYASLHFGFVPWGYAWSFPHARHQVLGMACLTYARNTSISNSFNNFLASLGIDREETTPWQGYPLPYGNFLDPPGRDNVLLVGDACGLADPLLGEGIYYAHRSAQIAAQVIAASRHGLADVAGRYRQALNHQLIRELRWIKIFRTMLFLGGRRRFYRGLKLLFRLWPHRLEDAVQGSLLFSNLALPWVRKGLDKHRHF